MRAYKNKIYMAFAGVSLIAIGVIFLCNPTATLSAIAWLIGIAMIFSGFSTFGAWARTRGLVPGSGLLFVASLFQVVLGLVFLSSDAMAALLPIILAIWLLAEGIGMFLRSTDYKAIGIRSWWILCLCGIFLAVLGIVVLGNPIENGGSLVSIILGVGTIMAGLVDLVSLVGVKILEKKLRSPWERMGAGIHRDDSIDEQ